MPSTNSPKQSTLAVWGGEPEHEPYERATQVPVVHSVSFGYQDMDTWHAVALGQAKGHIYSRNTNPTVRAFEDKIRDLEGAEAATSFSSGMAAISAMLIHIASPRGPSRVHQGQLRRNEQAVHRISAGFRDPRAVMRYTDFEQMEAEIAQGCKSYIWNRRPIRRSR